MAELTPLHGLYINGGALILSTETPTGMMLQVKSPDFVSISWKSNPKRCNKNQPAWEAINNEPWISVAVGLIPRDLRYKWTNCSPYVYTGSWGPPSFKQVFYAFFVAATLVKRYFFLKSERTGNKTYFKPTTVYAWICQTWYGSVECTQTYPKDKLLK